MSTKKINVLVCDDIEYICKLYCSMLNHSDNCKCVGTAGNECETIAMAQKLQPDVILLDIQMDSSDSGLKLIPQILETSPASKIIIISVSNDSENIFKAIQLGAKDYFVKDHPFEEILEIIENVYHGENKIRSNIVEKIMEHYSVVEKKQESLLYIINKLMSLSRREMEILRKLCSGMSYNDLSKELFIEEVTIRVTVNNIIKKTEFKNIQMLVEHINKLGIFSLFENKLGE